MTSLRQSLVARAEQRMALLPRMLQSIEILQLATVDLLALIDRELEQNETLELVRPEEPPGAKVAASRADGDDDAKLALLHAAPDRGKDLLSHVRDEVALLDLSSEQAARVLALAERLDGRGYLAEADEDLRQAVGAEGLGEALGILRSIEPRGLGARGPIDAMLLQVDATDPDRPAIEAMLSEHLDALSRNRLPEVARALDLEVEDVVDLLARIGRLDPRPAERFTAAPAPGIRPDVVVQRVDGRYEVVVDDECLPVLGVSANYAQLARDPSVAREVRSYLGGKLRAARGLIEAVESRKRTLCTVAAAILAEQPGFLARGRRALRPLRMVDIAERVGLHTSTVSRAIAGKHLGSDHGVIALREFFDGGVRADGSEPAARGRAAILELIREAVAGEDARSPLSDDDIARSLAARGVRVARRTVAKHRADLGIPPAARRRRFGAGGDPR